MDLVPGAAPATVVHGKHPLAPLEAFRDARCFGIGKPVNNSYAMAARTGSSPSIQVRRVASRDSRRMIERSAASTQTWHLSADSFNELQHFMHKYPWEAPKRSIGRGNSRRSQTVALVRHRFGALFGGLSLRNRRLAAPRLTQFGIGGRSLPDPGCRPTLHHLADNRADDG